MTEVKAAPHTGAATHPRYIVAQRSTFPFGEWVIEYSVIDTGTNGNARTKCVVFEEDDEPACDGLCVDSADIGVPGYGIAYPHPGCPLHAPDEVCGCGNPDRCLSPTHGQITLDEALVIRHAQNPGAAS